MQRWMKGLGFLMGMGIVAGACTGVEHVAAPEAARYNEQPAAPLPPDSADQVPQDGPPADSAGGRWGGYMGGGG